MASGGEEEVEEKEDLGGDVTFSSLTETFAKVTERDRRHALRRLTLLYDKEDRKEHKKKGESSKGRLDVAGDGSQVTNVVVDNSFDRKLTRFSGAEKLGQGEVNYRRWRRAAVRTCRCCASSAALPTWEARREVSRLASRR